MFLVYKRNNTTWTGIERYQISRIEVRILRNNTIYVKQTSLLFLRDSVCILLREQQSSAPAAVWEGTQRCQLSVPLHLPWSSLHPATPPGLPCSQDDPAADLSYAEGDEAGKEQRGSCCCRRRRQVRNILKSVDPSSPDLTLVQSGGVMMNR